MATDIKQPPLVDFYLMDELLTEEERSVRDKVRAFCDTEVTPIINDYWERAKFPFELIPKLAVLNIAGGSIKGYGCPGMSNVAGGLIALELARGDASVCTFFGVHSGLAMSSLAMLGSEEQKQHWLPAMARMEKEVSQLQRYRRSADRDPLRRCLGGCRSRRRRLRDCESIHLAAHPIRQAACQLPDDPEQACQYACQRDHHATSLLAPRSIARGGQNDSGHGLARQNEQRSPRPRSRSRCA